MKKEDPKPESPWVRLGRGAAAGDQANPRRRSRPQDALESATSTRPVPSQLPGPMDPAKGKTSTKPDLKLREKMKKGGDILPGKVFPWKDYEGQGGKSKGDSVVPDPAFMPPDVKPIKPAKPQSDKHSYKVKYET